MLSVVSKSIKVIPSSISFTRHLEINVIMTCWAYSCKHEPEELIHIFEDHIWIGRTIEIVGDRSAFFILATDLAHLAKHIFGEGFILELIGLEIASPFQST